MEEEPVLLELIDEVRRPAIADADGAEQRGDRDRGRALDVVIVRQVLGAVLGEQRAS